MIQRKQTLFLLVIVFASVALSIINCNFLDINGAKVGVSVSIIPFQDVQPNTWHYVGTGINFLSFLIALIAIFLYKKRNLQMKLCYALMLLQLSITLIVSFCPVVVITDFIKYENAPYASIVGIISMMAAYFAMQGIKKDIELLKSADRIR